MYTFNLPVHCDVPRDFVQQLQPKPRQVYFEMADGTMVPVDAYPGRYSNVGYQETENPAIHTISVRFTTRACHMPTQRKLSPDEL